MVSRSIASGVPATAKMILNKLSEGIGKFDRCALGYGPPRKHQSYLVLGMEKHKGMYKISNDVLVFLDQHLDRLWQGAATIGMKLDFTREQLVQNIWKTLEANEMHDNVHVRIMVTRGIKKTPSQDPRLTISGPNVVIIAEHKISSSETKEKGITLFTSTIRRGSPDYLDPRLNCHSKLHEV